MEEKFEINAKDRLLYFIRTRSILEIVDNILQDDLKLKKWEETRKQKKENNDLTKSNSDYLTRTSSEKSLLGTSEVTKEIIEKCEERYTELKEKMDLIEHDANVAEELFYRIMQIDKNSNNKEQSDVQAFKGKRALDIQVLSSILNLENVIDGIEKTTGYNVQDFIAGKLEKMSTHDLISIFQMVPYETICKYSKINDIYTSRIKDMTEAEFLTFIYKGNCKTMLSDSKIRAEVLERIKKSKDIFSTIYLTAFSSDDEFVHELLKKTKREEILTALTCANLSKKHTKQVNDQIIEIINSLSQEELTRYLIYYGGKENNKIQPVVEKRMRQLDDNNLKFIFWLYSRSDKSFKESILDNIVIERGLAKETEGFLECPYTAEEEDAYWRIYQEYNDAYLIYIKAFLNMVEPKTPTIYENNSEKTTKELLEVFTSNEKNTRNYEEFINYIVSISETKDEDLYKLITFINKRTISFGDEHTTKYIRGYLETLVSYLGARILRMDDENFLLKMYVTNEGSDTFFNSVYVRMLEKGMEIPRIDIEGTFSSSEGSSGANTTTGSTETPAKNDKTNNIMDKKINYNKDMYKNNKIYDYELDDEDSSSDDREEPDEL